ncbi:hypothetical protein AB0I39_34140 [Kitasatospora purpeofusca]|uniref:hypothetical protein n=1 Tax=Kitasatospora purpeofusca TaxID=67352 RepID=UPI0033FC751C
MRSRCAYHCSARGPRSAVGTDEDSAGGVLRGVVRRITGSVRASAVRAPGLMLLCIDPDIQSSLPDPLFQGPALAGVALLDEDGPSCSVRYLALTAADGSDGVHVLLCTPGGAPVYYGHPNGGDIADSTVTFPLFAVERPGVGPIALSAVSTKAEIATDRLVPDPDS